MAEKMLIDASHSEETRVVVVRGNRIEEFDFESEHKKQIRGNIYLAKVTRVEPSLQAAFVDYGGNRHGFLAFAEIHPDYYQIPLADRQALLKAEAEEARREDDIEPMETSAERKSAASTDSVAEVVAQAEAAEAAGEAAEAQAAAEKPKAKAKPKRTRRAKPKASEETAASQESEAPEGGPSEDGESDKSEMAAIVETDSI
ncbi:ribonuclease E/G, partial [Sinorhizobium medicae]